MYSQGLIIKDWRNIDLSFGLIFPNTYKIGSSSYTIRFLYFLLNSRNNIACERFFVPEKIKYPASKDFTPINNLRSIESNRSPQEFDILGFSLHYENDFKNVLWFLEKSGIPIDAKDRREMKISKKKKFPCIIAGGVAATSNPLPLSNIFDAFFIGDCEPNVFRFLDSFIRTKREMASLEDFLKEIRNIPGVYIPSFNNEVNRLVLRNLDDSPNPTFQLISKSEDKVKIFEENFFLEVNRGCPFKCKFCISSFHNSPFRNRSYENIIRTIEDATNLSNIKKISLIGSCVSSHPKFNEICEFIINKGIEFSIPSIRLDHITPKIIKTLEKAGIKTITIAPETGSDSLRENLGKKFSNEKIIQILTLIRDSKIKNIKFYFILGLPGETEDEVDKLINLMKNVDELGFLKGALKVNINPFIPKLNTPYEHEVYYYLSKNKKNLISRFMKVKKQLMTISSIDLKFKDPKDIVNKAKLQTLLSLGDDSVSKILFKYYQNGANMGALRRAEKELNWNIDDYLIKILSGYKPWHF